MFQQPTFSGSAATYATSLVRINKPQLLTTALGDLSELTGALDSALHSQDMSETERIGNAQRSWDLSNLHSVTTNLQKQTVKQPVKQPVHPVLLD